MKTRPVLHVLALLVLFSGHVSAQSAAPKLLPFQGRLTDQDGVAVSNGVRLVQFKIFAVPTGGSPVWAGELHRTTVNGGLVNVLLGSKTPLTSEIFENQLYLEITVDVSGPDGTNDNAITLADPPMLPRQVILPTLFAQESRESRNTAKLQGFDWSALLANGSTNPLTGKISGTRIADSSLTGQQIAPQSIGLDDLGPSVTNEFFGINTELAGIRLALTNLEATVAGLRGDIAALSNCCASLHTALQVVYQDLKNPWVPYATDIANFAGLAAANNLEIWEYGALSLGEFVEVKLIKAGSVNYVAVGPYSEFILRPSVVPSSSNGTLAVFRVIGGGVSSQWRSTSSGVWQWVSGGSDITTVYRRRR